VQKGFFAFYKSVVQSMNSAGYGILTFVKRREVRSVKNGGIWLILMFFCLTISLASWQREAADVSGETEIALEEKYIALTFDDGPHPDTTPQLLDGLKDRGAKATFFVVGTMAEKNREILVRMQREGHQVGNHTYEHVSLGSEDAADAVESIQRNDALLRGILDEGCYWVRPPWGYITKEVQREIHVPMVYWSVDTQDWLILDTEQIVNAALTAGEGDIVLMHDIYPTTVEAALTFVDIMQERGYTFLTVEELMEKNDVAVTGGTMYRKGDGSFIALD